jgi:hypothetical protein
MQTETASQTIRTLPAIERAEILRRCIRAEDHRSTAKVWQSPDGRVVRVYATIWKGGEIVSDVAEATKTSGPGTSAYVRRVKAAYIAAMDAAKLIPAPVSAPATKPALTGLALRQQQWATQAELGDEMSAGPRPTR